MAKLYFQGTLFDMSQYIFLLGNGTPGNNFTLTPQSSPVAGNFSGPKPLTLSNLSQSALPVQLSFAEMPTPAEFTQTNNCGAILPAQSICTIMVDTTKHTSGTNQALLLVSDGSSVISHPVIDHTDTVYDFGDVNVGGTLSNFILSSTNSPIINSITGTNAGEFSTTSCATFCTTTTSFSPSATGLQSALLTSVTGGVTSNYLLEGTGVTVPTYRLAISNNNIVTINTACPEDSGLADSVDKPRELEPAIGRCDTNRSGEHIHP